MSFIESAYSLLHHNSQLPPSSLDMVLYSVKSFISSIGTFIIVVGVMIGLYRYIIFRFIPKKSELYGIDFIRKDLGQTIVLGLEFIIAADVVETTTTPDYYSLGILGVIVIIRTFLSFSLSKEISLLSSDSKKKTLKDSAD